MTKIFISHTKKDIELCDSIDRIAARAGIKAFRSEFEDIPAPAWKTIKRSLNESCALFLAVGKELVNNTRLRETAWNHTQNWISFEVGIACQLGIDVWAVYDEGTLINFPMPYINNLISGDFKGKESFGFRMLKSIFEDYRLGNEFNYPFQKCGPNFGIKCPYEDCGMEFNLFQQIPPGGMMKCPQCLRELVFNAGFYL